MKGDWLGHAPLGLALLLLLVELTMWYDCYEMTQAGLQSDRHIAISAACNEEYDIYQERLDCADIRRSLKPGTAWIRSGSCLLRRHNIFAVLGWMELAIAGAALFLCLLMLIYYRIRLNKLVLRQGRSMQPAYNWPANSGLLPAPYPAPQVRQVYQNGMIIEEAT